MSLNSKIINGYLMLIIFIIQWFERKNIDILLTYIYEFINIIIQILNINVNCKSLSIDDNSNIFESLFYLLTN